MVFTVRIKLIHMFLFVGNFKNLPGNVQWFHKQFSKFKMKGLFNFGNIIYHSILTKFSADIFPVTQSIPGSKWIYM